MDLLEHVFVLLHLLGMAAIVGGWVAVRRGAGPIAPVLWGARAQLLTGLVLVGILESGTEGINHAKIGVKLLVAVVVAGCAEMAAGRERKGGSRGTLLDAAGGLAVANAAIAVLWV